MTLKGPHLHAGPAIGSDLALADDPKKNFKAPKPKPKKCYSGDQVRGSGKTATLENGKTYICDNGRWKEYLPLEPLAPTTAK